MYELQLKSPLATTQYVTISTESDHIWDNSGKMFVSPDNTHWADYAFTLNGTGVGFNYISASFPTDEYDAPLIPKGKYIINYYSQIGDIPESTDTLLVDGYFNYSGMENGPITNWVTLSEVKTYLGITATNYDALLNQLIPEASLILTNSIKRNVTICAYYEQYDGNGLSYLKAYNYPIVNITNVISDFTNTTPTIFDGNQFVFNTEGTVRWGPNGTNYGFCPGYQNYLIAYQAGYNVIPQDLKHACLMYLQFSYYYSKRDPTVDSKKAKDVQIQYGRSLMGDFSDGVFAPIEAILDRYRQPNML